MRTARRGEASFAVVRVNKFLLVFFVFALALFLQNERVLSVWGINPHLTLVLLALLIFAEAPISALALAICELLALAFLWTPFWTIESIVLGASALVVFFAKDFLTGNKLVDFCIGLTCMTGLFYGALALLHASPFPVVAVLRELAYNMLIGFTLWLALRKFTFVASMFRFREQ